ncbi:MAG: TIGR04211 family SH3 domain-containing protein [Desulfosalsimonas sp.]
MKKITLFAVSGILCLVVAASAAAQTRYVTDLQEITLRSGPGLDYRIQKMLVSGQQVEVLETQDRWSKVRLPDDTTGWVFSKFIDDEKPASMAVKQMREEIEPLRQQAIALKGENQRLIERNQELAESLEQTQAELEQARQEYEELKEESEDFLKMKEENQELKQSLEEKQERIDTLEKQVSDAFLSSSLKWFLAGGGVLVLGIIFGRTTGSRKKRSSLA